MFKFGKASKRAPGEHNSGSCIIEVYHKTSYKEASEAYGCD